MKKFVVYCHIFPNKKKYIGITCQKPEYRWNNGNGYKNNDYLYNAILKYKWHNIEHKILYTNLSKEEAEEIEKNLIKEWKLQNKIYGYNLADGGNVRVITGRKHSEETKIKIGKANKGKKLSKKQVEEMKANFKGKHFSPKTEFKKGKNHIFYGIKKDEATRIKISKKHGGYYIVVEDKETKEITRYFGLRETARNIGLSDTFISECLNGRKKSKKYNFIKEVETA